MISAGEDDFEIDRISWMHTSCLGFSSLIFDYEQDYGFDELIELCKPVWQAVDANPGIIQKLVSFLVYDVSFMWYYGSCCSIKPRLHSRFLLRFYTRFLLLSDEKE